VRPSCLHIAAVSVEAVEQFQVETSGTGVEFNGQGSENYSIKSGTGQFHGSGFEYLRNTVLDARGFFPAIRPVEHQNEFGATIGGPIIKKKLFFFFSYDGWRYRVTSPTQLVSIPTLKERTGDFTELGVNIYDPLTTVCVGGNCTRTQFSEYRVFGVFREPRLFGTAADASLTGSATRWRSARR
jgi:hypothetical protein